VTERDELEAEREFQDFLKRKRSPFPPRSDDLEPPEALDRWVLQRASDGIRTSEQPKPLRTNAWAVPFATAATVVIAIGVFLNIDHAPPGRPASDVAAIPAARDTSPPAAASPLADSVASMEVQQEAAAEPAIAEVQIAPLEQDAARAQLRERSLANQSMAKAAPAAPPRAEFAPPPPAAVPPPATVGSASVAASAEAQVEAQADAAKPAPDQDSFAAAARVADSAVIESRAEQSRSTPRAAVSPSSAGFRLDADRWWQEIERLRLVGDATAAERELADFRKAYPNDERGILTPAKP
jgi:hypothetical protein